MENLIEYVSQNWAALALILGLSIIGMGQYWKDVNHDRP